MSDAPNYIFEGNPEQKAYAAEQVHNRLRAETRLTNGRAALWYMGGVGILLALIGLGVGLAFWGFARYTDVTHTADKLADTLSQVLSKVTVEAKGEVTVRDGEMVLLDADGQTVKLEPGGTVRVEGGTVQATSGASTAIRPSNRQLYGSNPTQERLNEVVEYTTFHPRPFGKGKVMTGWNFNSNRDAEPSFQYCYYVERSPDNSGDIKTDLAHNGKMLTNGSDKVDVSHAAQFCQWFDGSRTQITAGTKTAPTTIPAAVVSPSTAIPRHDAPVTEWQQWCRITYPEGIQDWCLDNMGPGAKKIIQSSPGSRTSPIPPAPSPMIQEPAPTGEERIIMKPAKVKSF